MKRYIAYQGTRITIEWYYNANGRSPAFEHYKKLPESQRDSLIYLFYMMDNRGKISDTRKFRYEGDCIFVFKVQQERFFCFFDRNSKIIITNAYKKKSQRLRLREKEKALAARKSFVSRYDKGIYYDKKNYINN